MLTCHSKFFMELTVLMIKVVVCIENMQNIFNSIVQNYLTPRTTSLDVLYC